MRKSILSSFSKRLSAHSLTDFKEAKSKLATSTRFDPDSSRISLAASAAFSAFRQHMMTLAPRLAKSIAVTLPIPVLAPVYKLCLETVSRKITIQNIQFMPTLMKNQKNFCHSKQNSRANQNYNCEKILILKIMQVKANFVISVYTKLRVLGKVATVCNKNKQFRSPFTVSDYITEAKHITTYERS